jgi:hypothetical protein
MMTQENNQRDCLTETVSGENIARETPGVVDTNELERRRQRARSLGKRRRIQTIDGRIVAGRDAKEWQRWAYEQRGGKRACTPDVRRLIEYATLRLYTALSLQKEIVEEARRRGNRLSDGRTRKLSSLHYLVEQAMGEWRSIGIQLGLDKPAPTDLASMLQKAQSVKQD